MWVRRRLLTEEFPGKTNAAHSTESPSREKVRKSDAKRPGNGHGWKQK